ncbi:MAG: PrsW family intramembrane metalloprotease [Deltaproteobacteria bacterium]|nr:PrsW family intramembrane metalloprotease [Deltaproteobacteria bacterium]
MSLGLLIAASVAFAVVPPFLYAFLIWWCDWYERESPGLVIAAFLWGAFGAAGIGAVCEFLLDIPVQWLFQPSAADFLVITFAAPVIEEMAKGAILLLLLYSTEFDNLTDGIVYGAIIGLGFSLTENIAYFIDTYLRGGALAWLGNILFRSAFCCALHATATAVAGAAIGAAKFSRRRSRWFLIPAGFLLAILVHMGWNGFLSLADVFDSPFLSFVSLAALPMVGIALGLLFWWSLRRERAVIRAELAAEVQSGWLPERHIALLINLSDRHIAETPPPPADRPQYLRTLTELAFRRMQARLVPAEERAAYERMVAALRERAMALLGVHSA